MNLRPLIIDETTKVGIAKIVKYAQEHVHTMEDLIDIINKNLSNKKAGFQKEHTFDFPFGYRVVYSEEEQKPGRVRHMSISVDEKGKLPNDAAVAAVMTMIGFKRKIGDEGLYIYLEDCGEDWQAINVLEVI